MPLPDPCTFAYPTFANVSEVLPVVLAVVKGSGADYSANTKVHCLSTAAAFGLGMAFPPDKGPYFAAGECPQDVIDACHAIMAAANVQPTMQTSGVKTFAAFDWKKWLSIVLAALQVILSKP